MFKSFVTCAIASVGLAATNSTVTITPEQGAQLACMIYTDDMTANFDLTALQHSGVYGGNDDYDQMMTESDGDLVGLEF